MVGLELCIWVRGWLGQLIKVIVIIIVAVVVARWAPSAVLPLIAGLSLGGWLVAGLPTAVVA